MAHGGHTRIATMMKELIHQYGAWIVFALVFLESIGLPLPGEAILVSAAIFAGTTQDLSIALILVSAISGAIFGSIIGFWIGDRCGYPLLLRYGSYIGLTETRIKIAQYPVSASGNGGCPHCSVCGCAAIGHWVHCGGEPDAVRQVHNCQ
jgi:membrane protein DedA with SNARE-associated domain